MDDQKLKDYFKFDEEDLQANQQGELSERQKNDILNRKKKWPAKPCFGCNRHFR